MVNWWFWVGGFDSSDPLMFQGLGFLGVPRFESQTTGPQTTISWLFKGDAFSGCDPTRPEHPYKNGLFSHTTKTWGPRQVTWPVRSLLQVGWVNRDLRMGGWKQDWVYSQKLVTFPAKLCHVGGPYILWNRHLLGLMTSKWEGIMALFEGDLHQFNIILVIIFSCQYLLSIWFPCLGKNCDFQFWGKEIQPHGGQYQESWIPRTLFER